VKDKYTLAEIEGYLRKAAQAVGLDWGIAEEAGKSARWLAAFGLPGPELMLAQLQQLEGKDYQDFIPDCSDGQWRAKSACLCPIITGAALADRATAMLEGGVIKLARVAYPLLLAATVGQAAHYHQTVFTTKWAGVSVHCFENGLSVEGNRDDLLISEVDSASCRQGQASISLQLPSTLAYAVDTQIWATIDRLAFRTYAPATAESRAGAGAGMIDND